MFFCFNPSMCTPMLLKECKCLLCAYLQSVEILLHQFNTRITGENGVATNVIHLMNGMETWDMKITSSLTGTMPIHDNEWAGLLLIMEEWLTSIEEAVEYVGGTQREDERIENRPHTRYFLTPTKTTIGFHSKSVCVTN